MDNPLSTLRIADRCFHSRLLVGTGKFANNSLMREALEESDTQIVTVALRRADLSGDHDPFADILDYIDPNRYLLLPNTSGAMTAEEAVRMARLAASAGLPKWVKLEIHPDPHYLLPDPIETLKAAEQLVREGFVVMPYINADPVLAKRLQEVGTATVMPLGSPIGSNHGIQTRDQIRIIIDQATVPVVVDACARARNSLEEKMAGVNCSSPPRIAGKSRELRITWPWSSTRAKITSRKRCSIMATRAASFLGSCPVASFISALKVVT